MNRVLQSLWYTLYPDDHETLEELSTLLDRARQTVSETLSVHPEPEWYKHSIIYCLYVDLFNNNFKGLVEKLPYLQELGVSCLWLLPVLDSPFRDAGFDIRDYCKIRRELLDTPGHASFEEENLAFRTFLDRAHAHEMNVIFDMGCNHTSNEHAWFQQALQSRNSPYYNYYIWSDHDRGYHKARIIFKGLCDANWEFNEATGQYYFHRFFEFQPDLNYRNPRVLFEIISILVNWRLLGVDGFRLDAVPYLWKEEDTDCENLDNTHLIVKIIRLCLDYIHPGTLLLAEANQEPHELSKYFGVGDECHAAYHFPLTKQIFTAIAAQNTRPIIEAFEKKITPDIPLSCQWFTFLRHHDEFSLEKVSGIERNFIYTNYCKHPEWDFRMGEGISARLSDLFDHHVERILTSYAILFSLPGTPIIFYGDEFGKKNDTAFYQEMSSLSGKADSRYLGRGRVNWSELEEQLLREDSPERKILDGIKKLIRLKRHTRALNLGTLRFIQTAHAFNENLLIIQRKWEEEQLYALINLGERPVSCSLAELPPLPAIDLLGSTVKRNRSEIMLNGYEYYFITP